MPTQPAWDDLDAFLRPDEFATTATVTLQDGVTVRAVVGIFDAPYLNAQLGEYEADTYEPRFLAKASDLAGVLRKSVAVIDGKTYDVLTEAQEDGNGMATLKLAPRS